MKKRLFVFSADALVYEDLKYLETLPNFKKYLAGGALVKNVRSVYPTITYPAHATISTGMWPASHGVVTGNQIFQPGNLHPPWMWFHDAVKTQDIFDAAKKGNYSTAAVFWPSSGNHPSIDFLIDEYWTQGPEDTMEKAFTRAGSSPEMIEIIKKYFYSMQQRQHPSSDYFVINCVCDIIRQYKPEFFMIHPANIDGARHRHGLFNEKIIASLDETDQWIGRIMAALDEAGVREETNFFLISDHGQMEIKRGININVLLADNNLIRVDEKGKLIDWDAYSFSAGMSAHVFLKNPNDSALYEKTHLVLKHLCDEGIYGISRVFTKQEALAEENLDGEFSFVLETDGYTSFGDDWKRPVVKTYDFTDYRYGRATHGYLPEKGPQPILAAKGPDVKDGVTLEKAKLIDLAPTFAKLLGVNLPCDGTALADILK